MIIWLRNLVFVVLILSMIYTVLSIAGRYKARKRLQAEYAAAQPDVPQKAYIAQGLVAYDRSTFPKLLSFVFVVPALIIAALIYLAQYS